MKRQLPAPAAFSPRRRLPWLRLPLWPLSSPPSPACELCTLDATVLPFASSAPVSPSSSIPAPAYAVPFQVAPLALRSTSEPPPPPGDLATAPAAAARDATTAATAAAAVIVPSPGLCENGHAAAFRQPAGVDQKRQGSGGHAFAAPASAACAKGQAAALRQPTAVCQKRHGSSAVACGLRAPPPSDRAGGSPARCACHLAVPMPAACLPA